MPDKVRMNPGFQHCNLSHAEMIAVLDYTLNRSSDLNAKLRKGTTSKDEVMVEAIERGLSKLADYKGTVYRGTNLPEAIAAKYQVGAEVSDPAFLSTSITKRFPGPYQISILSKHGKFIAPFSMAYDETEVIFKPSTKFIVTSRKTEGNQTKITLEEI